MPREAEPLIGGVKRIISDPPCLITNQNHVISRISLNFTWKHIIPLMYCNYVYILANMKIIRNIGIDAMLDTIKRIIIRTRL